MSCKKELNTEYLFILSDFLEKGLYQLHVYKDIYIIRHARKFCVYHRC